MKKIEYILSEYGFVLKIVLSILWVLWAVQSFQPVKKGVFGLIGGISDFKNRDFAAEAENNRIVQEFVKEKVEQARAMGDSYPLEKYYQDLTEIENKVEQYKTIRPVSAIAELRQQSWEIIRKKHYTMKEIEQASSIYVDWRRESDQEKIANGEYPAITWDKVLSWLIVLYRRTIFLVFFFYLARMADRKGVLATILAGKKKFVLATILWPVYFFKYPYNVVREIRVEAELRRLKGLFRVFTARESRLVREVANSSFYKQRLAEYRQQNIGNFKRGLFLALMATLFLHLLLPFNLRASEKRVRSSGLIVIAAGDRVDTSQNLTEDAPEDNQQVEQWAIPPGIEFFELLLLIVIVKFLKDIWYGREREKLDRVPRSSLFGVFNFINQTMKGTRDEYGQEDNLLGCGNWDRRTCFCH